MAHAGTTLPGVQALRQAVANYQRRRYGLDVDPGGEVQVKHPRTRPRHAGRAGALDRAVRVL